MTEQTPSVACDALFFGAHPDDVELFCGASVACLARAEHRVMIADLTRGELASNGTPEQRRQESLRAAAALGALEERPVLGLPDGGVDPQDPVQVEAVVALLRRVRPQLVVAPWPRDRHPDHEAAGALIRRAHFLAGVRAFAPRVGVAHRSRRLLFYPCHEEVVVQLLLDVGSGMEAWQRAVETYHAQFFRDAQSVATPINRPGFIDAARARRAHWGNLCGVDHAEGFLHDGPWPTDIASLFDGGGPR